MTRRPAASVAALTLAAVLAAAGCASTSRDASDQSRAAVATPTRASVSTTTTTLEPANRVNPCDKSDPVRSYRPIALPPPGQLPTGAWADRIRNEGALRVGVDENTFYFSFKNPDDGRITGFEADIAREIARAVFGNVDDIDTKIEFKTVTTSEKFRVVRHDDVDLTIDVATIGCSRWDAVDFSTPYYEAYQQLMVRGDSDIKNQDDLAGKRVCVTTPSSSETFVRANIPTATIKTAETRTGCLTQLQENDVDAIVLPSSILAGLHDQDTTMKLLPGALRGTPDAPAGNAYGIAANADYPELTRFVNALLEQWRRDRTLDGLQEANTFPPELVKPMPEARYLD